MQGTRGRRCGGKRDARPERTGDAHRGDELICFPCSDQHLFPGCERSAANPMCGLSHDGSRSGQESCLAALGDGGFALQVEVRIRWRAGVECEPANEKRGSIIDKRLVNKLSCAPEH